MTKESLNAFIVPHRRALTWNQKAANLIVAGRERIVDPAAADEESPLVVVVDVGQGSKAVHPQAEPIELRSGDSIIAHQPAGRGEGDEDANEGNREHRHSAVPRQRSALHVLPTK